MGCIFRLSTMKSVSQYLSVQYSNKLCFKKKKKKKKNFFDTFQMESLLTNVCLTVISAQTAVLVTWVQIQ